MGLVDYSDSEGDSDEAARFLDVKPARPPPAAAANPAKRPKKEINLALLQQKHGVAIDTAPGLPTDFFDSAPAPIEEDAGEAARAAGVKGWSLLSAMLPPPQNTAPAAAAAAAAAGLFRSAKPLHAKPRGAAGPSSSMAPAGPAPAGPAPPAAGPSQLDDDPAPAYAPPTSASLRPRLDTSMYASTAAEPAAESSSAGAAGTAGTAADGVYLYDAPAGPSMGDAAAAGYADSPFGEVDEDQITSVSLDAMRKAAGPAMQVAEFSSQPKEEVKIAANFWSRATGNVESQYQASATQKRKHQINSLAADAQSLSAQLNMRKSSSLKSKKETAAKYGW